MSQESRKALAFPEKSCNAIPAIPSEFTQVTCPFACDVDAERQIKAYLNDGGTFEGMDGVHRHATFAEIGNAAALRGITAFQNYGKFTGWRK